MIDTQADHMTDEAVRAAYQDAQLANRAAGFQSPTPSSFDLLATLRRAGHDVTRAEAVRECVRLGLRLADAP